MTGHFITLEGGEGCGKSTQTRYLAQALNKAIATREPGGTTGAEAIRDILMKKDEAWLPKTELLLYLASRHEHVEKIIKPALKKGQWVVCDRFSDSTQAYQASGQGVTPKMIEALQRMAIGSITPELTFILDIDPKQGITRVTSRAEEQTRYEAMDLTFHQRVRKEFLNTAQQEPERCVVINADQTIAAIHQEMVATVNQRFNMKLKPVNTIDPS